MPGTDRGTRPTPVQHVVAAALVIVAIVGWWAASSDTEPIIVPNPLSVFDGVARLFYDPSVIGHTLLSTVRVIVAVILATLAVELVTSGLSEKFPGLL